MAAIWECPLGRATPDSACESGCSPQLYVESLIAQKRLVWNARGKRADLPTISSFQSGVRAPDRAEVFDDRCAEQSHSVSGDELAQRAFRLSCVHSPGALRQPAAPLTIAPMTAVTSASPAALRYENGSRRGWLRRVAVFIAGAALSFCLAQADGADPVSAAKADRQAAPPAPQPAPLNQTPYVPPIRIGLRTGVPISGVSAPFRSSAASRRDGELS